MEKKYCDIYGFRDVSEPSVVSASFEYSLPSSQSSAEFWFLYTSSCKGEVHEWERQWKQVKQNWGWQKYRDDGG